MYLLINNQQYPVARRRVTSQSVVYSEVNTEPESLSGVIQMYSNEGFLLSEDNVSDYLRHTYQAPTYGEEGEILSYGILTLTNLPEPEPLPESEPQPEPEPGPYIPTDHDVLNALLGIGGDTE